MRDVSLFIRPLRAGEEPALYAFVGARNVPGGQLCLHLSDVPDEVEADLASVEAPLLERCLVIDGPDGIRGAVSWDVGGPDDSRSWLFGPWVAAADETAAARALLEAALARLPPSVRRVDNYLDEGFAEGLAVHTALGFARRATVHVMRAEAAAVMAGQVPAPAGVVIEGIAERDGIHAIGAMRGDDVSEWHGALAALHDEAFPGTHLTWHAMLARGPARDRVLVAHDGRRPLGYVHLHCPEEVPDGLVEYIAVMPSARGRGIGRALLSAGARWLVEAFGLPAVYLTVHAENRAALGVYRAAGFAPHRTGIALTLTRV